MLHAALYALPDITVGVDPRTLTIVDVNRAHGALGYGRDEVRGATLDALLDTPRDALAAFLAAADAHPLDARARLKGGGLVRVTARASTSAAAAAQPCVLVVLREAADPSPMLDELERLRAALEGALEGVARVAAAARGPAAPAHVEEAAPASSAEPLPEISLEQYAALRVEEELAPERAAEIAARYGLATEAARAHLDHHFSERIEHDAAVRTEWAALCAKYRTWFQAQKRSRVALPAKSTVLASRGAEPSQPLPFKTAEVPELTLDQYAALRVELDAFPERRGETLRLHGIVTDVVWRACEADWEARLVADPTLQQRLGRLSADLRKRLVK